MASPFAANAQARSGHTDQKGGYNQPPKASDRGRTGNQNSGDLGRGKVDFKKRSDPVKVRVPDHANTRDKDQRKVDREPVRSDQNHWQPPTGRDDRGTWNNDQDSRNNHRFVRGDRDDWQDILYIGGFFDDLNFLSNDDTICFSGYDGALYPVWQYDNDCRSSDRAARARAELFGRTFFYRDGHRFERKLVTQHGERYYQFVRTA